MSADPTGGALGPWGSVFGALGGRIWSGYTRPSDPPLTQVLGDREAASIVASIFGQAGIGPRRPGGPGLPPVLGIAPPAPPLPGQPPPVILPGGQVLPPPSLPQRIVWGVGGRVLPWLVIGREVWRRTPDKAKREIKRRGKKVLRGAYDKAKEYGPWVAILAGFEAWRDRRAQQGTMPADPGPTAADAPTAMPGGAPVRRAPRTRGPRRGRRVILATPPLLPRTPGSPGDPGRAPRPTGTAPTALPGGAPAPSAPAPSSTSRSSPRVSWPSGPIGTPSTPPAPSRGAVLARQLLPFLPLLIPRGGSSRGRARAPGGPALLPALPGPSALPQMSYLTAFQGRAVGSRDCPPGCEPAKRKRKASRKTRTECYQGTYTETAKGLVKRKKRKVPCR